MNNLQYYTAIQSLTPPHRRVDLNQFIWDAVQQYCSNCSRYCTFGCKFEGDVERGQYHRMYITNANEYGHRFGRITTNATAVSASNGSTNFVSWHEMVLENITICCHWYLADDIKFMYARDNTIKKYIPFTANKMMIVEAIPRYVLADAEMEFKKGGMARDESVTLFPHNFPHQQPIILSRRWVVTYCQYEPSQSRQDDAAEDTQGYTFCDPLDMILPADIGAITENVAAILQNISSKSNNNTSATSSDFRFSIIAMLDGPTLDQDEFDTAMRILQYLGVEIENTAS